MTMSGNTYSAWAVKHPPPDLQKLVQQWGGYWMIPDEAWARHQDEMRAWQAERLNRWMR